MSKLQSLRLLEKMGGVTALLVSTLAISSPVSALNNTIGNSMSNGGFTNSNAGQSFINDPSGSGASINLNTWTLVFQPLASQTTAAATTLTIYNGTGNGGTIVGTSSDTSTLTIAGSPAVTWTFAGGLQIIDNSTYTAVLAPSLTSRASSNNPYPNGLVTVSTGIEPIFDLVFEGTFSAVTPVPFEFSPALGLGVLGGLWAAKKFLIKK